MCVRRVFIRPLALSSPTAAQSWSRSSRTTPRRWWSSPQGPRPTHSASRVRPPLPPNPRPTHRCTPHELVFSNDGGRMVTVLGSFNRWDQRGCWFKPQAHCIKNVGHLSYTFIQSDRQPHTLVRRG